MNEWEASCAGKVRYRSRKFAKEHAKKSSLHGIKQLIPYKCRYCAQWHLGHRPGEATYRRDRTNRATAPAVAGTPTSSS